MKSTIYDSTRLGYAWIHFVNKEVDFMFFKANFESSSFDMKEISFEVFKGLGIKLWNLYGASQKLIPRLISESLSFQLEQFIDLTLVQLSLLIFLQKKDDGEKYKNIIKYSVPIFYQK